MRIVDIARKTNLSGSTVHRILHCLVDENLIVHDPIAHRYRLDDTTFELGLPALSSVMSASHSALERIAAETGECCTLVLRSGLDSLSADRVLGKSELRGVKLVGGQRRPLGAAAGSVAILAQTTDSEVADVNRRNAPRLAQYGLSPVRVHDAVRVCRRSGYALMESTSTPDIGVLGVAVLRSNGGAHAALAVIAPMHKFAGRSLHRMFDVLATESRLLSIEKGFAGSDQH